MNNDHRSFPKFQATGLYLETIKALVVYPELSGKEKVALLHFAYALYARVRARHQISEKFNGDGGCAVPS